MFRTEISACTSHGRRSLEGWLDAGWPAEGRIHLDLETTGLSPVDALCVMAGVARTRGNSLLVEQAVARHPDEEAALLVWCARQLAAATEVVTFNGTAFDLPFLRRRATERALPPPSWGEHLDLLPVARRQRGRGRSCALRVLEEEDLGLEREDDPGSARSAMALRTWLTHGTFAELEAVLRHNLSDLISLPVLAHRLSAPRGSG